MLRFSKRKQLGARARNKLGESPQKQRAKTVKRCLELWSLLVRWRDEYTCQWCGSKNRVQAHHIVARSLCSVFAYFRVDNGVSLCQKCHLHRLKADPDAYIEFRDRWLAKRRLQYQTMRREYSIGKLTDAELIVLEMDLKRKVDAIR